MTSSPLITRWTSLSTLRTYVSRTVFSLVSSVSGSVEITLSPGFIFSIASRPAVVSTNVPATKHAIFWEAAPENEDTKLTPIWNLLYTSLWCILLLSSVIGLLGSIIPNPNDTMSKPSILLEMAPLILEVVWIAFPNLEPQVMNLPAIPPTPPKAPPIMAPSNAPWANPSRNEPPVSILVIPPIKPPVKAPFKAPIRMPVPIPCKPGTQMQTTATTISITRTISFQWSLHHWPTFFKPSQNFSQSVFSQSGLR